MTTMRKFMCILMAILAMGSMIDAKRCRPTCRCAITPGAGRDGSTVYFHGFNNGLSYGYCGTPPDNVLEDDLRHYVNSPTLYTSGCAAYCIALASDGPSDPYCESCCACCCRQSGTCYTGTNNKCKAKEKPQCLDSETLADDPIVKITFESGTNLFSSAPPANFDFQTTYQQRYEPTVEDGQFGFVNEVYNHNNNAWHTGAKDHTGNAGGYMFLVNADFQRGTFYNGTFDNLCVGLRYELSLYVANLCRPSTQANPILRFEVRLEDGNSILTVLDTGIIDQSVTLTWIKYTLPFTATSSSVNLLMVSNAEGGFGNDFVIDDIELRVCTLKTGQTGLCPVTYGPVK